MGYIEKGEIVNSVNYPNVKLEPKETKTRVIILAKNQPSIAREIDKILGDLDNLIKSRITKVRGDYAYYAFDIDKEISLGLVNNLENVEGINRVRVI